MESGPLSTTKQAGANDYDAPRYYYSEFRGGDYAYYNYTSEKKPDGPTYGELYGQGKTDKKARTT